MSLHSLTWDAPRVPSIIDLADYPNEHARWDALCDRQYPHDIQHHPLRYGPLSVAGYIERLQNVNHDFRDANLPKDPEGKTRLLLACGVTATSILDVIHAELGTSSHGPLRLNAVRTYVMVLDALHLPVDADALLSLLPHLDWGRATTPDFKAVFDVIHGYLMNADEEDRFLTGWLPTFMPAPTDAYHEISVGTALAASFSLSNGTALCSWCEHRQDYEGLGYLVWQDRIDFATWLHVVATRLERLHHENEMQQVQENMLQVLQRLDDKRPTLSLAAGVERFRRDYPQQVASLLQLRTSVSLETKWFCALLALGALQDADAPVQDWLNKKLIAQELQIGKIEAGMRLPDADLFNTAWYQQWLPRVAVASQSAALFLAQKALLGLNSRTSHTFLAKLDLSAFQGLPLGRVLSACYRKVPVNYADTLTLLLPRLTMGENGTIGALIIHACNNELINATTIRSLWRVIAPERFGKPIPGIYKKQDLLLYALTRQSPLSIVSALDAVGLARESFDYSDALVDWLNIGLTAQEALPVLPEFVL